MKKRVFIFDTTLRDGEQSPGCSMNIDEKVQMALQLERLKVDVIEAGFPISSASDFEAVRAIARRVQHATVAALCRTRPEDIDRAWEAIRDARRPRIHTFIATSDIHLEHKLRMNHQEVLQAITAAVTRARSHTADVEFSAEDASRSTLTFVAEAVQTAIRAGATTINLPDTVGYATPEEYGKMFAEIRTRVPQSAKVCLSAHCHDDLGLAVANSLAAIENGADQIECTVNGIGERAGNASLEEIVMALRTRSTVYHAETNIDTRQLYATSQLLSSITGIQVQPNKAIVGKNAFAHEAGIHQHGVLNHALTYEIMTPASVGAPGNRLVLGKHSGRHALRHRCRDLGFELGDQELEKVYQTAILLADVKKEIDDDDLKNIVLNVNGMKSMRLAAAKQLV
ncbi:MAG: 2-isopropylmalate synthase [bacterium]